jgi:hypothetical protein
MHSLRQANQLNNQSITTIGANGIPSSSGVAPTVVVEPEPEPEV